MSKEITREIPKSKISTILFFVIFVFGVEMIYLNYLKEENTKEYELLYKLKSAKVLYQKIDTLFKRSLNHQSFDSIVQDTKNFDNTLNHLEKYFYTNNKVKDVRFYELYENLKNDFEHSKVYIERYKSWKSLTVNSTRLLYEMHGNIKKSVVDASIGRKEEIIINLLDEIIFIIALISYDDLSNINLLREKTKLLMTEVESNKNLLKIIKRQQKHIKVLIDGYELIERLKIKNENLSINNTIDMIYQLLLSHFKLQDKSDQLNIYILNALIILLLIYIFIINQRDQKLHHKIRILNCDLEENNSTLASVNKEIKYLLKQFDKNVIASKTDMRGIITYASEAFCKISGYSQNELIRKPHNIVRHPDVPKNVYKEMWTEIKAGHEWKGEIKNIAKDGSTYWVNVTVSPEYKNGLIVGYSAVRYDITAKKELEILSHSLEKQVLFRTQELEEMVKKVEVLSNTDELTKLYNRRYYYQVLENETKRAKRTRQIFNYVLLDIDNFKLYNDNYGHHLGDVALQKLAETLTGLLNRPDDFVFRMGGEEFVITFISENEDESLSFSQKIIDAVSAMKIEHLKNRPYNVLTISGGLVSCSEDTGLMSENEIYKKADELLYLAKSDGRNRIKS